MNGPGLQRGPQRGETPDIYAGLAVVQKEPDASQAPSTSSRIASLPLGAQANAIIGNAESGATAAYRQMAAQMEASRRMEADLESAKQAMRSQMEATRVAQAVQAAEQRPLAPAGAVMGNAMAGASVANRANAGRQTGFTYPAGQASPAPAPTQTQQTSSKSGMTPEDAWLAHIGSNADGWLDMHPSDRAARLHGAGCKPEDILVVVMAIDAHCLKKTRRRTIVNAAAGVTGPYPNPYALARVHPAGQVTAGAGTSGFSFGVTIPWWLMILGGAGFLWWYAGRRNR